MSLLAVHYVATLSAEGGCETWERNRIVLNTAFTAYPCQGNNGSLLVTAARVLSYVALERRHLWQVMQRDNDC